MKPSLNLSLGNQASYQSSSFDAEIGLKAYDTLNQSKNLSKNTSLDLKKLDLSKDPKQSSSSLELLILLLNRSLKFSLEEILGLFTNNNKFLAHIIVKGIHEKFDELRIFFELMNENIETLQRLFQENKDDVLACLYALKPGFISKDQQCASLTIDLFQTFGKEIYDWFISKESKCSQTLLLGLKRHQKLSQQYTSLILSIIKGKQVEYFSTNFIISTSSEIQFLQIISKLIPHFNGEQSSSKSLTDLLQNNGVFEKWFEVGEKLYESQDMDNKLIFIDFIGEFMIWLPEVVQKNASVTNLLRRNWQNFKTSQFIPLVNQLMINLQKLAVSQSAMTIKLLHIISDIFNQTYHREQKREFIVQGVLSVMSNCSSLQSDIFILNYPQSHFITESDFLLINETVNKLKDQMKLMKIGDFIKEMLFFDILNNHCLGGIIIQIIKKISQKINNNIVTFINALLKSVLSNYVMLFVKSKNHIKNVQNQQQLLLDKKKNAEIISSAGKAQTILFNKKMELTITLVEKIIDIIFSSQNSQSYIQTSKNYLLVTNAQIKKNNFGMGTKRIINLLQKKLKVTKQQEIAFQEQNSNQSLTKSSFRPSQSLVNGKIRQIYGVIPSLSRIQVPQKISKQFDTIVAKRKKYQQMKAQEELKKKKEQEMKKILHKKELQKMNLIKGGFGQGEAQLKEQGFWNRFVKQTEETKIYLFHQIEDVHLQGAEIIMKKYSKLFKYLFTNYSNTMYSSKTSNFDENSQRKDLLSAVEIIKLLKDYTLILATNLQQVQTIIKDINIKIFQRKQVVNEVDYEGFQEFIKQFCLCVWSRNQWRLGSKQNDLKFDHLTLPELLMNFIIYLRNVFKVKGQNMSLFDVGEVDHKNSSPQVQELNQKLQINPNYILPQGFKKITDKKIDLKPAIRQGSSFPESYAVTLQVLDEIIYEKLGLHIIEPLAVKVIKLTAKPLHIISVKQRDPVKIKVRAMSTMIERRTNIHSSLGLLQPKYEFSKGIKKGMLSLRPEEKIIGEQVAYKLQQILNKIDDYEKQVQELPNKFKSVHKLAQPQVRRSFSVHKIQSLQKNPLPFNPKLQIVRKSQNYVLSKKQKKLQQERKRQEKTQLKLKRKKQQDEKYFVQLKLKLEQNKSNKIQQFSKIRAAQQRQIEKKRQKKLKIQEFTSKQVQKYKNMFEQMIDKKKRIQEQKQMKNQDEEQRMRKIRQKIESENKVLAQIRKETTQAIMDIFYGQPFKSLTKQYQVPLKAVFQYLQKHNANPLSKKKISPGQIEAQTWSKFNKIFEISPLIVSPKDAISIFKTVTKGKIAIKEHSIGLNYEQFLHCLLRECIKQKTIFGKIAQRIKDQRQNVTPTDTKGKKSKSVAKKVQAKNQFQEDEETDIKKLLKEPDIRDDIIDHYGDVSKFNLQSFRGLIFYLRMPFTKKGQQTRMKELFEIQKKQQSQSISNIQKLKEKLKAQYRLQRKQKKDTINQQTIKAQKTEARQQKNQSKLINSQNKPDSKQKNDIKTVDAETTKKTQKK